MLRTEILFLPLVLGLIAIFHKVVSPLTEIPGPWYSVFTDLWLMYQEFTSNRRAYIHALHQKYGPVVRLGPNEVSFTSLEAIKEIYSSGGSGYEKTEFYTLFMQFNTRFVSMHYLTRPDFNGSQDHVLDIEKRRCESASDKYF